MSTHTDETTRYSKEIRGDRGNYSWPVKFAVTGGYVGISQTEDGHTEIVLLSPKQFAALIAFAAPTPAKRRSRKPAAKKSRASLAPQTKGRTT